MGEIIVERGVEESKDLEQRLKGEQREGEGL